MHFADNLMRRPLCSRTVCQTIQAHTATLPLGQIPLHEVLRQSSQKSSGNLSDDLPYVAVFARPAARSIPIAPDLVILLQPHLKAFGTDGDGRLFRTARGGALHDRAYSAVWQAPALRCSLLPSKPPRLPGVPATFVTLRSSYG